MSEASMVQIIIALIAIITPGTIAAFGALRVSNRTDKKTDTVIEKTEEVRSVANGHLTAVTKSLAEANNTIVALEKKVMALEQKITLWMDRKLA